jgi:hypothetical protein
VGILPEQATAIFGERPAVFAFEGRRDHRCFCIVSKRDGTLNRSVGRAAGSRQGAPAARCVAPHLDRSGFRLRRLCGDRACCCLANLAARGDAGDEPLEYHSRKGLDASMGQPRAWSLTCWRSVSRAPLWPMPRSACAASRGAPGGKSTHRRNP